MFAFVFRGLKIPTKKKLGLGLGGVRTTMTVEIPNFRGLPQSDDGTYLQSRVLHGLYFSHFQAKGAICDRGSSSQQQQSLPSCFSLEPFPANLVHRWTNPSPNDCRTCYAHGATTFTRKSLKYCQVFTKILQLPIVRLENRINLIFFFRSFSLRRTNLIATTTKALLSLWRSARDG